ncbi:MAG: hypothetical protein R2702_02440 [Acidimicrobiales bacterium]
MSDVARPWAGRSHAQLAELARELLLCGHLIDRSGMPHLISRFGREGMTEIAIAEWMGASPVYAKRMQRLLDFEGDTVETTFKGMQLDIGAPPEFLDFRYQVIDDRHGTFHLDHCGALMDVEPMGDEFVHAMCHTIEDPTFDATATAANPRAQVRPVHRPPRVPADRHPHCAWTVTIEPDAVALPVPEQARAMARSNAAELPLAVADPDLPTDDGWDRYAAALDPDLVMERFSSATLGRICDEVALQGQLLARSYLVEVADRLPPEQVIEVGAAQAAGVAGVTTKRLAAALDLAPDLDGLAEVLRVHPLLLPRGYVDLHLAREGDALVVAVRPSPGTAELDGLSWPAILAGPGGDEVLHATVVTLVRTASVERTDAAAGELARWRIVEDPSAEPAPIPATVTLTEFSTGAAFRFQRRG